MAEALEDDKRPRPRQQRPDQRCPSCHIERSAQSARAKTGRTGRVVLTNLGALIVKTQEKDIIIEHGSGKDDAPELLRKRQGQVPEFVWSTTVI